jgi:large repetitive protein
MSEETLEVCFQLRKGNIMAKGVFNITLTVDAPPPPPLALAASDDLGPANVALPAGDVLPISGGTPPYAVTNVQGTVPPGVTINADGTVTGTPTEAGSFPLTISVQDSLG